MAFQTADVCNLADLLLIPIPQEIANAACNIHGAETVLRVYKIRQPDQMRIVQHLIAEIVQTDAASIPACRHNHGDIVGLHGFCLIHKQVINRACLLCRHIGCASAACILLIRRIAHNGIKFHGLSLLSPCIGSLQLLCQTLWVVFHPFQQVRNVGGVDCPILIAHQRPPGDAFCHPGLAQNKDLLLHGLLPESLCLLQRQLVLRAGQLHGVQAVCHIQGIQAGFGVHFQNPCLRVEEDVLGDLPLIHQTRLLQNLLRIELLVEEAVAAHHVAQMKVHHPPRGQNGFLVGVAEVAEDLGNALHTLGGRQLVRCLCHAADAQTRPADHILVVVFQQLAE